MMNGDDDYDDDGDDGDDNDDQQPTATKYRSAICATYLLSL